MTSEQEKVPTNDEMGGERISESKMQKIGQFTINSSKNLGKYMLETLKEMFQGLRHPARTAGPYGPPPLAWREALRFSGSLG